MTAKVITVTSQAGSSGPAIAQLAALELGYRYYDWDIVARAADLAHVSQEAIVEAERWPSFGERLLKVMSLGGPGARAGFSDLGSRDDESAMSLYYSLYIENVVRDLAQVGDCVIVGHAAQAVLHSPDVFKVMTRGSLGSRSCRLAAQDNVPVDVALEQVQRTDKEQGDFLKHVYHVNWQDPTLYNLTLDTDGLPLAVAAEIIVNLAGALSTSAGARS